MIVYHQAMDALIPDGATIFLGDSITQGLATTAISPASVNYGIGSATSAELLANLTKYHSLQRASAIFLLIGINDLGSEKSAGLTERFEAIVAALPNEVPLIWSGIMPTYSDNIDPAAIESANQVIRKLCSARDKCAYVDTHAIFSTGGSTLFRDGVHPNDQGYAKWIATLREAYHNFY